MSTYSKIYGSPELDQAPQLSIIIVTYCSADVIQSCLNSIKTDEKVSREIFVVDNASEDGTAEIVQMKYPDVCLISNDYNRGFSAANNQAIPLCRGRYFFFINPDVELTEGCLETAVRYMDEKPDVGLAGTKVVNPNGSLQETISYRYPGEKHAADEWKGLPGDIACVLGASMVARADVVRAVGGFDEDYFLYGEDQEMCLQIRRRGYKIGYIDRAAVRHIGGHSEKDSTFTDKWRRKTRAEYLFYSKHYKPETIRKILRYDRIKAWWRILTIHLSLPFLSDSARAQEKLEKYRAILEILDEFQRPGRREQG